MPPPKVGSTVNVEGPDTGFIGQVLAVFEEPVVVIQTLSGRCFMVPAKGHRFSEPERPEPEPDQ